MRDKVESLEDLDATLIAVDPHESWSAKFLLKEVGLTTDDVRFPLLMDPALTTSATYGVAFQMRIHVERSNRAATFVIDKAGILRYAKRGTAFGDRPKPTEIEEVLRGLK